MLEIISAPRTGEKAEGDPDDANGRLTVGKKKSGDTKNVHLCAHASKKQGTEA